LTSGFGRVKFPAAWKRPESRIPLLTPAKPLIGLETKFSELAPYLKGGKPLVLYVCGQSLNLILTLIMAYLMFGVLFRDFVE
jgi:hypothetical protein